MWPGPYCTGLARARWCRGPTARSNSLCFFLRYNLVQFLSQSWVPSQLLTWPAVIPLIKTHLSDQIRSQKPPKTSSEHWIIIHCQPSLWRNAHNPQDTSVKSTVWKSIVFIDSVLMKWRFQRLVWYLKSVADIGPVLENTGSGCAGHRGEWAASTTSYKISLENRKARKIYIKDGWMDGWIKETARRRWIKVMKLLTLCHWRNDEGNRVPFFTLFFQLYKKDKKDFFQNAV